MKRIKNLGCDPRRTVVIDDTPLTYTENPENALPIPSWKKNQRWDDSLLKILSILTKISFENDIREELARLRSIVNNSSN